MTAAMAASKSVPGKTDPLTQRHNGGAVFAMADGHVKYYLSGTIPVPTKPTGDPRFQL